MLNIRRNYGQQRQHSSSSDYHYSHGMALVFGDSGPAVMGGGDSTMLVPIVKDEPELAPVDRVEKMVPVVLLAKSDPARVDASSIIRGPTSLLFRSNVGLWDHHSLGEALLSHLQRMEFAARVLTWNNRDGNGEELSEEECGTLRSLIRNGKLGTDGLATAVQRALRDGLPIRQAFFVANGTDISEDSRGAILRACHHAVECTGLIWMINHSADARRLIGTPKLSPVLEAELWSSLTDYAADEYVSAVSAAYTSLDILYKLFVYFGRPSNSDPDIPGGRHFPDTKPSRSLSEVGGEMETDLTSSDAPMAIPHLSSSHFSALRNFRDSLVHDMAPDAIRTSVFVGRGGPQVGGLDLQYTQYLTRDVAPNGTPVVHRWVRRFYQQQRDAQHVLHSWLEDVWQTAFDTVEWLATRLENRAHGLGLM